MLRSALDLESRIYSLFSDLVDESKKTDLPEALRVIMDQEKQHQKILEDIVAGRLSSRMLSEVMRSQPFHNLYEVKALDEEDRGDLIQMLRTIEEHEKRILEFYGNLQRKSKIPFIKSVFGFLVDQEKTHLIILRKLLGTA
jgi:rubrerythrin